MKNQFIRTMILLAILAIIVVLVSCSLDTPDAPLSDNPWDPDNPAPPRAPIGLTGQVLSETSILLRWEDRSGNESGFIVEEIADPDTLWNPVDTVAASVPASTLENRHPATEYRYRVIAFNRAGRSAPPDPGILLNTAHTRPTAPAGLQALPVDGVHVELRWQDLSANESSFEIQSSPDYNRFISVVTLPPDSTHWMSDSLAPFIDFAFRVRAINDYGNSDFSYSGQIIPGAIDLSVPYDVVASAISETEISLSWSDSNRIEESFRIWQSVSDTLNFVVVVTVNSPGLQHEFDNRTPNTTYFYRIVAQNRYRESLPSSTARASTAEVVPWPPWNIVGRIENELDVVLTWEDNSDIETGYEVQQSVGDSLHYTTIATLIANSIGWNLSDCEPFIARHYRIRSIGNTGNSNWTYGREITPGSFAPLSPSDFIAEAVSPTEVQLNWRDNSRIEERFEIQVRPAGGVWSLVDSMEADIVQFRHSNRQQNTTYTYRLRAGNRYASSGWVESTQVTTPGPPPAPTNLGAYGVTANRVGMQWNMADDLAHSGFVLEDSLDGSEGWAIVDSIRTPELRFYEFDDSPPYIRNHFRIKSYNQYGASAWSNVDDAMPLALVAFVACNDAGIVAVDVTDPRNPTEIRRLDTPGLAQRVAIEGDFAYVADSYGGVEVFSIASPASMAQIGSYPTEGRAYGITVVNRRAYVAVGDSGVAIIDFTNSESPALLSRLRTWPGVARSVAIQGNYLFVAAQDRGVLRVDVSNPRSPAIRQESASPSSSQGLCIDGRNRLIVAEYSAGLRVLSTTDLSEIESIPLGGNSFDVIWGGPLHPVNFFVANFNRGVSAMYINPPNQAQELTTLAMPDDTWGVGVLGDSLLFACVDNAGLKIIDVNDPANPVVLGTFMTPGPARGVAVREYK